MIGKTLIVTIAAAAALVGGWLVFALPGGTGRAQGPTAQEQRPFAAPETGGHQAALHDPTRAGDPDAVEATGVDDIGAGAEQVAQAIADAFDVPTEDVLALQEQGIGFGALFQLYALAQAKGVTVEDLLATIPTNAAGEFEFAFGELRRDLSDEEQAALEAGPKNLGQLVSAAHRQDTDATSQRGRGHGRPE